MTVKTPFLRTKTLLQSTRTPLPVATTPHKVADLRVNYSQTGLDESKLPFCPFELFESWMSDAQRTQQPEPNGMTLSTVGADGRPAARVVLLKGVDQRGFVWYTNYESRKADHLSTTPFAALTFWWAGLERSVRIEGAVVKVSDGESDAYFSSRPPKNRLGAWVSDQSRPLRNRDDMEKRLKELEMEYLDDNGMPKKEIVRPRHWGGFRLVPDRIEFWKGRSARLHDRIVYERPLPEEGGFGEVSNWTTKRLQP